MNKKVIKIIVILVIIIVIIGLFILILNHKLFSNETYNKTSITIKGYTIDINSKEVGNPSSESYFSTSFNIIDNNNYTNTYNVDFIDLSLNSEHTSSGEVVYDIVPPEEVTINGKKFDYYLNDDIENATSATLHYIIPDGALVIEVSGVGVFDSNGEQVKTSALVDEKVLKSKELAGILNFTVSK